MAGVKSSGTHLLVLAVLLTSLAHDLVPLLLEHVPPLLAHLRPRLVAHARRVLTRAVADIGDDLRELFASPARE